MKRLTGRELNSLGGVHYNKCHQEKCHGNCADCEITYEAELKLKEYEDLEEQGLLLRLHFGIGDIVYEVSEDAEGNYLVVARKCRTNTLLCALNKRVGKTIFLTKEEAEQALAKMKEV